MKRRTYLALFLTLMLSGGIAVFNAAVFSSSSAQAESYESGVGVQFNLNPTINVTVSGDLTIPNLTPGDYKDSNNITVTANSNSIAGYSLSSTVGSSTNASTELRKDGTDTTNKFNSITTNKASLSNFDDSTNTWGYSYSTDSGTTWQSGDITGTPLTGYNGLPLYTSSNSIKLINSTTNGSSSVLFKIGARTTTNQIAGEYTNVINFIGVANPNPEIPTMQNLSPSLCTSTPRMAIDSRDNQYYLIARADDDNCWMLQNLRLGANTTSLALTSGTSNVSSAGFVLTNKLNDGIFHPYTIDDVPAQNNSSEYYCTEAYGCYYNWYTATAGSGSSYTASGSVDYSICPAGWTLPTGGSGGQFQTLATSYNNSAPGMLVDNPTVTTENTTGKIPGFLLGGRYRSEGPLDLSSRGRYWSRTAFSNQNGGNLYIDTSSVNATDSSNKYVGFNIRCLLSS